MKSRKARYRDEDDLPDDDRLEEERPRRGRKPKRETVKRRKLPWLLLSVLVLIAFLPTIVANTPLRNIVLSAALPTKELRVTVGKASLSWWSPPSIEQVQVWNAAGEPLLTAEAIRIDRAPGNLLLDSRNLGEIEIVRPSIYLKLRPDGNNLEDALRQAFDDVVPSVDNSPNATSASRPVTVAVRVVDGTIRADDATTGRRWRVQSVNVNYYTHGAGGGIGHGQLSGQIVDVDSNNAVIGTPGQFAIELHPDENNKEQLSLQVTELSLGLVDAWLRQYIAGTELSGILSGQGTATWTPGNAPFPPDLATSGALTIDRLDATAPALAGDRVRLARVELPWRLAAQPIGLVIDDLQLRSDIGQLAVRGTIDPNAFAQPIASGAAAADAAARHDVELRGSLDLARLAAMLPHALRIRSDTTITSGTIQLTARSQPSDGGQLVTGSLQTAQLAATNAGKPIRWDQPVSANFAIRRQQGTVRLDSLKCDSDFLRIDANGSPQQLAATAQFDLNRLSQQLGQFVDLNGVDLTGTGTAKVDLQQTAPDQIAATASGELTQLRIAAGAVQFAAGKSNFTANIRKAGEAIDVTDGKFVVSELRVTSAGWNINELRAELAGDAHWNGATSEISARTAQLVTSAVSVAAQDVRYRAPQASAGQSAVGQLTGTAAFRTDLARLAAWRTAPQQTPAYQPSGNFTGHVRFAQQGDRLTGELITNGQDLALANRTTSPPTPDTRHLTPQYQTIWQEPQLTIRGTATYDSPTDRLTFDQFQVQSNTLQAAASGRVDKLSTAADVQVNGTLNYDLAQITPLLRPYVGDGIQLTGREQAQFALAGQLNENLGVVVRPVGYSVQTAAPWSRRVRAQLQFPWSGANIYGLPIGAGKLSAALGDGEIRIEPLALAVGEGQLTAAPNIRLDPLPAELTLPRGPLITNVRISTEVSEAMLKFVAPVLAGATKSEGLFSMALDGARVPLGEPKRADAGGQLTVHSVRVVPGPMAQQWIGLAQQIESLAKRSGSTAPNRQQVTLLSVKDQQVNFHVVDGRVHHQNMEFQVGDVLLRSQGSVGFDETVALTLTVPIQDAWIDNQPLLSGLKGQSLQIPISGTLARPQMDQRAIASLTQQLLQGAAQQAVGGELNKALDKLFKPRQ